MVASGCFDIFFVSGWRGLCRGCAGYLGIGSVRGFECRVEGCVSKSRFGHCDIMMGTRSQVLDGRSRTADDREAS